MKISQINVGDHVVAYSTVFEVTAKRQSNAHWEYDANDNRVPPAMPVYCLTTKVIDGSKSVLPVDWMNTWVVQSNDLALHAVVERKWWETAQAEIEELNELYRAGVTL